MAKKKQSQKKRAQPKKAAAARKPAKKVAHIPLPEFKLDLAHEPEKYIHHHRSGARLHYTLFIIMLTIFNFLIFLALIPLMIIIKSALLIFILGGIGLVFGMAYLYLVRDIEHLQPRHHLFAAFYIPLLAVLNIILLFFIGRLLHNSIGYESYFVFYASAVYVVMFLLPYALALLFERLWPKRGRTI